MNEIHELLKQNKIKASSYRKIGKTFIVDANDEKFVIKRKCKNDEIIKYLKSRNFNYFPQIIYENDKYEITKYVDNITMPAEQKMIDMIDLIALLHSKTTYYFEVTIDDFKKIYEDLTGNIEYLDGYYTDMINIIETKVYMSPSQYLLARNINIIYDTLRITKKKLDDWFDEIKEIKKQRSVVLHNNLGIDHFLKDENNYLISWDKAKRGIPIFDLYKLYKKYGLEYDFEVLFKRYEKLYPLLNYEKDLLNILILLPDRLEFQNGELNNCKAISDFIDNIYKARNIVLPKNFEKTKEHE